MSGTFGPVVFGLGVTILGLIGFVVTRKAIKRIKYWLVQRWHNHLRSRDRRYAEKVEAKRAKAAKTAYKARFRSKAARWLANLAKALVDLILILLIPTVMVAAILGFAIYGWPPWPKGEPRVIASFLHEWEGVIIAIASLLVIAAIPFLYHRRRR